MLFNFASKAALIRHRNNQGRRARLESLERRELLAATPFAADWVADLPSPVGGMSILDSAADAIGNLVVIGRFSGTVDFDPSSAGTHNLSSELSSDVFVAKYSPSGGLLAAVDLGDIPLYEGESVASDGSGNVYVAVGYIDQATLLNGQVIPDPGVYSGTIIAKLDTNLQFVWASIATLNATGPYADGEVQTNDIAVDSAGTSVYFGGIMVGKGTFGTVNVSAPYGGFVSRINGSNGAFQWIRSVRNAGRFVNVAVDPLDANNVYARDVANAVYESLVTRLDGSGNTVWQKVVANNIAWGDMTARSGGVFLAGSFAGQTSIDQTILTSAGKSDVLAVRFNASTGNVDWAARAGGAEDEWARRIAVDADGNLFLAGAFDGAAVLGGDTLTESSGSDSFISQLDATAGAFLQSWRYGATVTVGTVADGYSATVADLVAAGGHAYAVGAYGAPGADFPDGSFLSTTERPSYLLHFTAAADPTRPRINGFIASPDPTEQGDPLSLSVVGMYDPDLRVDSVAFYHDINANRRLDAGTDPLVGVDSDGSDGWSITAPTAGLEFGEYQFLAQATYDGSNLSLPTSIAPVVVRTALTYVSSDVGKQIRDLRTIVSTLTVPHSFTIADVDVTLTIRHTYNGDLDVFLIHPDGTRIELFTDVHDNTSGTQNFTDTTLDDQAGDAIASAPLSEAPFTGRYRPEGLLSVLAGKSSAGVWRLEITDDARRDTGTLDAWSLTLSMAAATATATAAAQSSPIDAMVADQSHSTPGGDEELIEEQDADSATASVVGPPIQGEPIAPSWAAAVDEFLTPSESLVDERPIGIGQHLPWQSLFEWPLDNYAH